MTDNEIIKALEHCTNEVNCTCCKFNTVCICLDDLHKAALYFINSLQAEIDFKDKIIKAGEGSVETYRAEIEKLAIKIKSEAIKEFAERLKNEAYKNVGIDRDFLFYDSDDNFITFDSVADVIDFLSEIVIKEMVGDTE